MSDDKTKRGSPDNKRLNKGEPYEVAYARKKAKAGSGAATKRAAGSYCALCATFSAVGLISGTMSPVRKRESVRGYVSALCFS